MKTIIVSALTSLLVSLMTFILGLKSGKNQTDRARLQDLYKQLHTHFKEIKNGFITHRYKKWSDYKKIESINRIQYLPLVKELDRMHIAKLNGRVCGAKRPHSVFEQSICYLPV